MAIRVSECPLAQNEKIYIMRLGNDEYGLFTVLDDRMHVADRGAIKWARDSLAYCEAA